MGEDTPNRLTAENLPEMFGELQKAAFNAALRTLSGPGQYEDAEEVSNDTMMVVAKMTDTGRTVDNPHALVIQVARNKATDRIRARIRARSRRREFLESLLVESGLFGEEDASDPEAYEREIERRMAFARERLSPRQWECAYLFYAEEVSKEDIARRLRITVKTVDTHLYRARAAMKKEFR